MPEAPGRSEPPAAAATGTPTRSLPDSSDPPVPPPVTSSPDPPGYDTSGPPTPPLLDLPDQAAVMVPSAPAEARRAAAGRPLATVAAVAAADPARQLSLFGVEAAEPSPADLAGLLAGPGEVVRMGGTARVSVVVDDAWRVHVLVAELALRGLSASWVTTAEERHGVRTSYTTLLAPLSRQWLRGEAQHPPADFFLNGPRLRLWSAAAGSHGPDGFLLRLGRSDERDWDRIGAALAAIGLTAVLVGLGAGGPAYRITGRRRLARLAELVGDRPAAAPPSGWPGEPR